MPGTLVPKRILNCEPAVQAPGNVLVSVMVRDGRLVRVRFGEETELLKDYQSFYSLKLLKPG